MTVYALLVGIDKYLSVRNLNGCVMDVNRMAAFLKARVIPAETDGLVDPDAYLQIKTLTNEQATREAVIETFQSLLGQANNDDVALFYYSGHGSTENAPPEFWHLEPTRENQTLVCYDSRSHDSAWDLADKELGYLISQVAQDKENLHTLVILDSCHSGSGTRDFNEDGVRMATADLRERTLTFCNGKTDQLFGPVSETELKLARLVLGQATDTKDEIFEEMKKAVAASSSLTTIKLSESFITEIGKQETLEDLLALQFTDDDPTRRGPPFP